MFLTVTRVFVFHGEYLSAIVILLHLCKYAVKLCYQIISILYMCVCVCVCVITLKKQGKRTFKKPSSKLDNIQIHVKKVRYEIWM
jgi:SET domain-containing protein